MNHSLHHVISPSLKEKIESLKTGKLSLEEALGLRYGENCTKALISALKKFLNRNGYHLRVGIENGIKVFIPTKTITDQSHTRGRLYRGYRLINHGYYPSDRCVWWEAENLQTGEADFRATTRRQLKVEIDSAIGTVE